MDAPYLVYGHKRSGSVPVEATLLLLGQPYKVLELAPGMKASTGEITREELARINPMRQVPALRLPGGGLMTESAAILIHLADTHRQVALSPAAGDPRRPDFLRWMVFVAAQIYALVWARDDPSRLAADKHHEAVIMERTAERIAHCWHVMNGQITPGRYMLGDEMSVLDVFVTAESYWGPGRERFYEEAPKMADIVRRVDDDPRLAQLWQTRLR
jgi:GST-like protein